MPRLMVQGDELHKTASNYHFSAVRMDKLGAAEYTLVNIACDASSSVDAYAAQLEQMLKTVLLACAKSPRSDNLLLRLTQFSNSVEELHGFRLLSDIKESDYTGLLRIGGMTCLAEACDEAAQALATYGSQLSSSDYLVNGLLVVITDGRGNCGKATPQDVARSVENIRSSEKLESLTVVLIGVTNGSVELNTYLSTFADEAKITQYVDIGNATPGRIAKLGNFISRSISSTSQALGSGGPSSPIQFPK